MTAHGQTLLAKLASKFGPQTENLAVDALGHILSGSKAARLALSKMIEAGGAVVGEIAQVRTQATGKEGERPDLAGFDRDGRERVLIEAKFWAGLTGNQPVAYLERLPRTRRRRCCSSRRPRGSKPSGTSCAGQWRSRSRDSRWLQAQRRRSLGASPSAAGGTCC